MKIQLIMLPNQPILVSDEQIFELDKVLFGNHILTTDYFDSHFLKWEFKELAVSPIDYQKYNEPVKIIAGIPELPSINSSELSEEDCSRIGWVAVEKLAWKNLECFEGNQWEEQVAFEQWVEGFKTAQSLNEKKYTVDQMRHVYSMGIALNDVEKANELFNKLIDLLSQPKVFDVEIEQEELFLEEDSMNYTHEKSDISGSKLFPKITNNSIKISKVL